MNALRAWPRIVRAVILGAAMLHAAAGSAAVPRALVTGVIDDSQRVRLAGNTRPEVAVARDLGAVPDSLPLSHLQLLLQRPAEREAALQRRIEALYDPLSPQFHHWLTNEQLDRDYGLAAADLAAITGWLRKAGFTVETARPGSMLLDFSGNAGAVRRALHTQLHYLDVSGRRHLANQADPEIPAALAAAVRGIVSLHDFRPHLNVVPRAAYATGSGAQAVVPADLATIYDLSSLFNSGISGQGQTVVLIEDTDVYNAGDFTTFRTTFGLSAYSSAPLTQVHPGPGCTAPGANADDLEAALDVEWASAAAPGATIELAACASTATTFGGLIALQNLVSSASPPAIVSISYGECEALNGATANAAYNALYQQAASLGTSVFVSSGDQGAAGCDPYDSTVTVHSATHGIGVNAFASTPYNVAVGGTDFGDSYAGSGGSYWTSTNSAVFGSALSYVPEIPWNDACAGVLLSSASGFSSPYGSTGYCNSLATNSQYLTTAAGSGGPSGCATGTPAAHGIVGGSCHGYAKPSWQGGVVGIPGDGVRDLPDVSLFAANGLWGHYYVYCNTDHATGTSSCPTRTPSSWSGAGGTSFAAPILAGIQALVNQKTGARQGNPNPVYYALAAVEYGAAGSSICNSSNGRTVNPGCVFYDVTQGDMDVSCIAGTPGCYAPSGSVGVLSTTSSSYTMAYGTAVGWDFATGIGTLNAANLVSGWSASQLALSGGGSVNGAGQLAYTWTLSNGGPFAAAGVVLTTTLPTGFTLAASGSSTGCSQSAQLVTCTVGALAVSGKALLTVVIQPAAGVAMANLTFSVGDSNGELFPANDSVATALAIPSTGSGVTDGPMPLWAYLVLGGSLLGVASGGRRP